MPWIKEEEGYHEPKDVGRGQRDDEREEKLVLEEIGDFERLIPCFYLYGFDRDENGGEDEVKHECYPEVDHRHVEFVRSLRPVSKCQDETGEQSCQVKPFENNAQDVSCGA